MALDNGGNVYVTGSAVSYDFPVTAEAFQTTVNSRGGNAFVAKLNMGAASTATTPTVTVTPASSDHHLGCALDGDGFRQRWKRQPHADRHGDAGQRHLRLGGHNAQRRQREDQHSRRIVACRPCRPRYPPAADGLIAKYVPDAASSSTYNFASGQGSVYVMAAFISVTPPSSTLTGAISVAGSSAGDGRHGWSRQSDADRHGDAHHRQLQLRGYRARGRQRGVSIPPGTLAMGFNSLYVSYSGDSNYAPVSVAGSATAIVGAVVFGRALFVEHHHGAGSAGNDYGQRRKRQRDTHRHGDADRRQLPLCTNSTRGRHRQHHHSRRSARPGR